MVSRIVCFVILMFGAAACAKANLSGAGFSKKKDAQKAEDEASSEEDEQETGGADQPAEVAGRFLTTACQASATAPQSMPAERKEGRRVAGPGRRARRGEQRRQSGRQGIERRRPAGGSRGRLPDAGLRANRA